MSARARGLGAAPHGTENAFGDGEIRHVCAHLRPRCTSPPRKACSRARAWRVAIRAPIVFHQPPTRASVWPPLAPPPSRQRANRDPARVEIMGIHKRMLCLLTIEFVPFW